MTAPPKVNKLKAAMEGMSGASAGAPTAPAAVAGSTEQHRKTPLPPSRQGKRVVSAYIDPAAARQLKHLATARDASMQTLLEEALNDLFRKHAKSAIA